MLTVHMYCLQWLNGLTLHGRKQLAESIFCCKNLKILVQIFHFKYCLKVDRDAYEFGYVVNDEQGSQFAHAESSYPEQTVRLLRDLFIFKTFYNGIFMIFRLEFMKFYNQMEEKELLDILLMMSKVSWLM